MDLQAAQIAGTLVEIDRAQIDETKGPGGATDGRLVMLPIVQRKVSVTTETNKTSFARRLDFLIR